MNFQFYVFRSTAWISFVLIKFYYIWNFCYLLIILISKFILKSVAYQPTQYLSQNWIKCLEKKF